MDRKRGTERGAQREGWSEGVSLQLMIERSNPIEREKRDLNRIQW